MVRGELKKAPLPIVETEEPKTRLEIAFPVKAARPIVTTLSGMVTCVKPVLPKAPSPIEVIVRENATLVSAAPLKAIESIEVTVELKATAPVQLPPLIKLKFESVY